MRYVYCAIFLILLANNNVFAETPPAPLYIRNFIYHLGMNPNEADGVASLNTKTTAKIKQIGYENIINNAKKAVDKETSCLFFSIQFDKNTVSISKTYAMIDEFATITLLIFKDGSGGYKSASFAIDRRYPPAGVGN
jgi:hypothetical protein